METLALTGGYNPARFAFVNNEQLYNWYIETGGQYPTFYPTPGYELLFSVFPSLEGRGLIVSNLLNAVVAVIGDKLIRFDKDTYQELGTIEGETGLVDIVENQSQTNGQICINDGTNLFVYNVQTANVAKIAVGFEIQDITYQDTYFIAAQKDTNKFYITDDATTWPADQFSIIDSTIVAIRSFKEKLYVFGKEKTAIFYDTGAASFPFQKNILNSFVYGTSAKGSVSVGENYIAWLGSNSKTSPVMVVSDGSDPVPFTTNGIDNELDELTMPNECESFFYQINNHVFYQINFTNEDDNLSLCYDFSTKIFTRLVDKRFNLHPVKAIARFNNTYFALTRDGGNVYEFSSEIFTFDTNIVPRVVMSKSIEYQDKNFSIPRLQIYPEQGDNKKEVKLQLSISRDRGRTFNLNKEKTFVETAERKALMHFDRLGAARFWAFKLEAYSFGKVVLRALIDYRIAS